MNFVVGLLISVGCMLGGYAALGGHLHTLLQPYEFMIIGGAALGIFVVANPVPTIKDTGKGIVEAILGKEPKQRDFLDLLSLLHALMREMRSKSRGEVETHIDNPTESDIFLGASQDPRQHLAERLHLRLLPPDRHRQRPLLRNRGADG